MCGEPGALSATLIAAARLPAAAGVKTTEIEQLLPADNTAPQVVASENELAFAPVIEIPEIVRDALPLLVSVTLCAGLAMPIVALGKEFIVPKVT